MMGAMTEGGGISFPGGVTNVQVSASGGVTRLVVNGQDLSRQVAAVTIAARPMQIPRVILDLASDVSWDGDALTEYRTPTPDADLMKAKMRAWLDGLNWAHMQACAAEGAMVMPIGEAFRQALIDQLDRDW